MQFAEKFDLDSLKSYIDKFHIGQLKTTPGDLSKLSDALKNEILKKAVYI